MSASQLCSWTDDCHLTSSCERDYFGVKDLFCVRDWASTFKTKNMRNERTYRRIASCRRRRGWARGWSGSRCALPWVSVASECVLPRPIERRPPAPSPPPGTPGSRSIGRKRLKWGGTIWICPIRTQMFIFCCKTVWYSVPYWTQPWTWPRGHKLKYMNIKCSRIP